MNSKLDAIPTTYAEADHYIGDRTLRPCGNNTTVERTNGGVPGSNIVLVLHSTIVVTYQANGVLVLNTGGYHTVTTKDRLNRFLPGCVRIWQKDHVWYVTDLAGTHRFEDGETVDVSQPAARANW